MGYNIDKTIFKTPDDNRFEQSIEKLLEHSKNKTKFRKAPFLISSGGIDCCDYTNKGIKRSKFAQKNFANLYLETPQQQAPILYFANLIIVDLLMLIFRSAHLYIALYKTTLEITL